MRLYWARNDGMTGHVFLGPAELELLGREMLVQGMTGAFALAELRSEDLIGAHDVEAALAHADSEPLTLDDPRLWRDWLAFLEGAAANGGILVRG